MAVYKREIKRTHELRKSTFKDCLKISKKLNILSLLKCIFASSNTNRDGLPVVNVAE